MSEQNQELKSDNLKIVALFKKEGKDITSIKFGEAKTKAGEIVMWDGDQPTQGMAIAIQSPDGGFNPAVGTLELEDGTVIEAADGLIVAVTAPAAAPDEAPVEEQKAPVEQGKEAFTPDQAANIKRTVESVIKETHFTKEEVEAKFNALPKVEQVDLSEVNTKLAAQEQTIVALKSQITSLIELLSKAPATTPATTTTTAFSAAGKESIESQHEKIMAYLKKQN